MADAGGIVNSRGVHSTHFLCSEDQGIGIGLVHLGRRSEGSMHSWAYFADQGTWKQGAARDSCLASEGRMARRMKTSAEKEA